MMARCGLCGEPAVSVLKGTAADIEANPNIIIRCLACAATEEAEAITKAASDDA
jgi:hypothetical protein